MFKFITRVPPSGPKAGYNSHCNWPDKTYSKTCSCIFKMGGFKSGFKCLKTVFIFIFGKLLIVLLTFGLFLSISNTFTLHVPTAFTSAPRLVFNLTTLKRDSPDAGDIEQLSRLGGQLDTASPPSLVRRQWRDQRNLIGNRNQKSCN